MSDVGYVGPDTEVKEPETPKVTDEGTYEKVKPGSKYLDPEGQQRFKPISGEADYAGIGEGEQYADPEGQIRTKPKFEGVGFTAQTLYDMSLTDKEKRKSLERSYPGKVKQDTEGYYVEDEGKFLRPGRGGAAVGGFAASAAAPVAGAVLGGLGGAALSAPSGPGMFVGGTVGAGTGGMAGQLFNDAILQLSGVYDRSTGEEAANVGLSGLTSMAGAGIGRGVSTLAPTLKEGISHASTAAPSLAAKFLGATAENTTMARELAEKGVMVPPSAWAKEAPHVQNMVEVFDPAFRTQQPLKQSAEGYYEKSAGELLNDMGVKTEGSILSPETSVPTQRAGEAIMAKTLAESKAADDALAQALEARKTELASGAPGRVAQRDSLVEAEKNSRQAAQKLIDEGFSDIQRDVESAFKVAKADANTGDLWQAVGDKMRGIRQGIGERATKMYNEADELAGAHLPDSTGLSNTAEEFLTQLPPDFQSKYPDIVRKLRDLAGVRDPETGAFIKEPVQPTFGQLHNLRSQLRGNVNWYDLTSDIREGTYKFFSRKVDGVLHDKNAVPELQAAAKALDSADKFYADNIKVFNSNQIKAIMRGLEAGEPADPANLYRAVVKEGQTDLTAKIRDMVGPNLWAGVKAADTQAMLDASKNLVGDVDGRVFAKEVLDRYRSNMLQVVHGKEASDRLLKQAQSIAMLDGKLPLTQKPGDTMTQLIARAHAAGEEAKKAGAKDPLGTLKKEMKGIENDHQRQVSKLKAERRNDPLGFLYDPTTGAAEAVNKILGSEDLIIAAAGRFGEQSSEFAMLRQIYAQRILQGTLEPGKRLEKIAPEVQQLLFPEVQQLLFPGVTLKQMQTLAKEMSFLMDSGISRGGAGASMSAFSKVEHPITNIRVLRTATKLVPGLNAAARSGLTQYYALITKLMTSPATLRFVEKGLNGNAEEQAAVRKILSAHLQRGGAVGSGAGQAGFQAGEGQSAQEQ